MQRYWTYFKYVMKHKLELFKVGRVMGLPITRLIMHDMSKFSLFEFTEYAYGYYYDDGTQRNLHFVDVDLACLRHQAVNPHHYQAWLRITDSGEIKPVPMTETYVKEMVADWIATSRTVPKALNADEYYNLIKRTPLLHSHTKYLIDVCLSRYSGQL